MSNPESSNTRESIHGLAAAQSALASRLDSLAQDLRRLPGGSGEPDDARLHKLQEAVADLATGHHDVHRQLEALTGAVEQLAIELDDGITEATGGGTTTGDQPRPASFVPPVTQRGWRPRLKGWARVVLRSTLGKVRHVWDATHPRPPWGDEVRLTVVDGPARLPSLTVVIHADPDTVAGVEAGLARQTDDDVTRWIHDPTAGAGAAPAIDTDYVWDVGPGALDLPATFIETARLLLATEALDFVCFETPDGTCQWLVARELRHADGGLDLGALSRRAKRRPGSVLGKVLHSPGDDDDLLPEALCRPRIRRRVRRSGSYVLAVATKPRTVRHQLTAVRAEGRVVRPNAGEDRRPGVLLLLTAELAGGLERVVTAMLEDLAEDARLVLATTVPPSFWMARWRALERFTPHAYTLGGVFAEELHAGLIQELIARHDVHRLIQAGGGKAWPALAGALRRRLPDLDVAEPELRPVINPAADLEPVATPKDAGERLRRELGWPAGTLIVAMRADLIAGQRPEDFVALAHRFRDDGRFRFLLVGDGPLNASVRDLRRLFGLHNLHVERAQRDLEEVLGAAGVVCTTAESDPFPHTVLAALRRRRPVVAAAASDLPRLLETGPCGIVVPHPGDLDGFEAALRSLAAEALRCELGNHGPQAISLWSGPQGDDP